MNHTSRPDDRSAASPIAAPPGHELTLHSPPFRIGIWCDFGATLTPHEGIGVFTHNLAAGFLKLGDQVELAVVVHPGEEHVMDSLQKVAPDRVKVLPEGGWTPGERLRVFRLVHTWLRCSEWVHSRVVLWSNRARELRSQVKVTGRRALGGVWRRPWLALALSPLLFLAFLLLWAGYVGYSLASTLASITVFPLALADLALRRLWNSPHLVNPSHHRELIDRADCDIWIIPYLGFEYPIDFPAVLFIHDLVIHHHPQGFDPRFVSHVIQVAERRASEALLCACMSEFIRETDLLGVLRLPPAKVRMVRPAAPRDLPTVDPARAHRSRPRGLRRRYLFYPSAFRGYKNHALMVGLLAVLKERYGETSIDVVFTGPNLGTMPANLEELASRLGVRQNIHVLGKVDRLTLAALYQGAFAVAVPSLYEQGSFPIYEALHSGCPVACSDIPALREQCACMGDAMLYFDPHDPADLARTVIRIRDDREAILRSQQVAGPSMWSRTWEDVAGEWLPILRKAAAEQGRRGDITPIGGEGRAVRKAA